MHYLLYCTLLLPFSCIRSYDDDLVNVLMGLLMQRCDVRDAALPTSQREAHVLEGGASVHNARGMGPSKQHASRL